MTPRSDTSTTSTPLPAAGPTTIGNGQGLCANCNYTKESPGWTARMRPDNRITVARPDRTHRRQLATHPAAVRAVESNTRRTRAAVDDRPLARDRQVERWRGQVTVTGSGRAGSLTPVVPGPPDSRASGCG